MATLTLTAWVPQLHPPPCNIKELALGRCIPPNKAQHGFLILNLGFLSIASGGIKPCNIPFSVVTSLTRTPMKERKESRAS